MNRYFENNETGSPALLLVSDRAAVPQFRFLPVAAQEPRNTITSFSAYYLCIPDL